VPVSSFCKFLSVLCELVLSLSACLGMLVGGGVTVQRHACDSFVVLRTSDAQWHLVRHMLAPVVTILWVGCVVMMFGGGGCRLVFWPVCGCVTRVAL
jgi:hypothetical protein